MPTVGYGRVFVSHDEWVEFAMEDAYQIEEIKADLTKAGMLCSPSSSQ
jgi:hypothetical protein